MVNNRSGQRNPVMSKAAQRYGLILDEADQQLLLTYDILALRRGDGLFTAFARTKTRPKTGTSLGRLICSPAADEVVDHRNGNPWDNRRINLRICKQRENLANARISKDHSCGFKGVSVSGRKFQARIGVASGKLYLGSFDQPEAAARAYDNAARKLFGDFCAVNFPEPGEQSAHRQAGASDV